MSILDNYLLDLLGDIPNTDFLKLYNISKKRKLKKHEIYIEQGTYSPNIFYVKKGVMRGYYLDESGEEKTVFIRWQNEFGADPHCYFDNKPARLTWEALENSEIIEVNSIKLNEMSKKSIFILKIKAIAHERLMKRLFERVEDFVIYSHCDRFKVLLKRNPDICERIPDKYLASYLGITPVSLSRIKKRLFSKN